MNHKAYIDFPGRIVIIGFGSIGQGVLPLILRHIGIRPDRITIVTAEERGKDIAQTLGVRFVLEPLVRENFRRVLDSLMGRGDFVLNLSVEVSSIALIKYCWERGAMYLDTCIEPWAGGYTDNALPPARRTNYALREEALALRSAATAKSPTAIITHGANPGLVSHFVKVALQNIARDLAIEFTEPASRMEWAKFAQTLGVRTIHIAERDTQVANVPKELNEFVNTWSVDGFVGEGCQPAELGWGTHERNFPRDGKRFDFGGGAAIYLGVPGAATRVRTWTPLAKNFLGYLITHGEAISISDYFTVEERGQLLYRPTAHYAYHPCNDAILSVHEFAGRNWQIQDRKRILMDEIIRGTDELGVLIAGHKKNALLVRLAAVDRRGAQARALHQRHRPAGHRLGAGGCHLGDGEPRQGAARARRARLQAHPRDLHALPGHGFRFLHRLDTAVGSRTPVCRGHRQGPIPGSSRTCACSAARHSSSRNP